MHGYFPYSSTLLALSHTCIFYIRGKVREREKRREDEEVYYELLFRLSASQPAASLTLNLSYTIASEHHASCLVRTYVPT